MRCFDRMQHVALLGRPVPIAQLKLGDAVVAFSRRDVLTLRDRIAAGGHPVSVIYGALPPEVRRREAERFAGGDSHILVATDAIGMGLIEDPLPDFRALNDLADLYAGLGRPVPPTYPLYGRDAHRTRAGIHADGLNKFWWMYAPFDVPRLLGRLDALGTGEEPA